MTLSNCAGKHALFSCEREAGKFFAKQNDYFYKKDRKNYQKM